jgi:hypothetical protein
MPYIFDEEDIVLSCDEKIICSVKAFVFLWNEYPTYNKMH